MRGFEVIAKLTDHFRKYGTAGRELTFVIHGSQTRYRMANVTVNGNDTQALLVAVDE